MAKFHTSTASSPLTATTLTPYLHGLAKRLDLFRARAIAAPVPGANNGAGAPAPPVGSNNGAGGAGVDSTSGAGGGVTAAESTSPTMESTVNVAIGGTLPSTGGGVATVGRTMPIVGGRTSTDGSGGPTDSNEHLLTATVTRDNDNVPNHATTSDMTTSYESSDANPTACENRSRRRETTEAILVACLGFLAGAITLALLMVVCGLVQAKVHGIWVIRSRARRLQSSKHVNRNSFVSIDADDI
jgi:hypothetical protein